MISFLWDSIENAKDLDAAFRPPKLVYLEWQFIFQNWVIFNILHSLFYMIPIYWETNMLSDSINCEKKC